MPRGLARVAAATTAARATVATDAAANSAVAAAKPAVLGDERIVLRHLLLPQHDGRVLLEPR